jgi:hypothetical protein
MFELEHVGRAQHAYDPGFIDYGQVMQGIAGEQAQRLGNRLMDTDRKHRLSHDAANALLLHDLPRSQRPIVAPRNRTLNTRIINRLCRVLRRARRRA